MVLSFDSDKIDFEGEYVLKESSEQEKNNHTEVIAYVNNLRDRFLECGLRVQATPFIDYSDGILITRYCPGMNLEDASRDWAKRSLAKKVLKEVMCFLKNNRLYWGDIAPRNIIVDVSKSILWIMDFERTLYLETDNYPNTLWERHLHGYALEEISCFFEPRQVNEIMGFDVVEWRDRDEWRENFVEGEKLSSRRKRLLLKKYFGEKKEYTFHEVFFVEMLMALVAFPYVENGSIKTSMTIIEDRIKLYGYAWYLRLIDNLITTFYEHSRES